MYLIYVIFPQDITFINYEALMNLAKDEQIINFNNLVTQSHPGDNMVKTSINKHEMNFIPNKHEL